MCAFPSAEEEGGWQKLQRDLAVHCPDATLRDDLIAFLSKQESPTYPVRVRDRVTDRARDKEGSAFPVILSPSPTLSTAPNSWYP